LFQFYFSFISAPRTCETNLKQFHSGRGLLPCQSNTVNMADDDDQLRIVALAATVVTVVAAKDIV